jgi:pimeloyl-ACP methyl ester carboxylesterase
VSFLKRLEALGLPVIAMEMPYVSLRVAPEVPDSKAHVKAFSDMLDAHGYDRAFVVGHSWGSNVLSWVVQVRV